MLIYYQKYYKGLNLLLVTLVGLCCGMFAGALIEAGVTPTTPAHHAAPKVAPASQSLSSVEDLNLILQRNIFDPAGQTDLTYNPELLPSTVSAGEPVAIKPSNIVLLGTVVADAENSLALLQVNGELDTYRIGDSLDDGSVLETVARNQVQIRLRDKRLITLTVEEDAMTKATAKPGAAAQGSDEADSGIRQVDDTRWLVSRDEVEKTRANFSQELRLAQMQPRVVDGKTDGFLIRSLRRNSILNKLGLRRGDVVMSVNGISLDSPEKALQIFQQLREARQIDLAVERRGQAMSFAYELD